MFVRRERHANSFAILICQLTPPPLASLTILHPRGQKFHAIQAADATQAKILHPPLGHHKQPLHTNFLQRASSSKLSSSTRQTFSDKQCERIKRHAASIPQPELLCDELVYHICIIYRHVYTDIDNTNRTQTQKFKKPLPRAAESFQSFWNSQLPLPHQTTTNVAASTRMPTFRPSLRIHPILQPPFRELNSRRSPKRRFT